jgi:hypothetical protein
VPVDGSATYESISAASGLEISLVVRTIRAAMALNIFDESAPGQIRHTAISRLLATNEDYYSAVGLQIEDLGPASMKLIEAWKTFGYDVGEPNQSAFSLQNGGKSLFTMLSEDPERARRFDLSMKYQIEQRDFSFSDIVDSFDWSVLDHPGSQLFDLGGGYGQNSQVLHKHTQNLTFVVQDLAHVVEQGRQKLPLEFQNRISFEAHSFMDPQEPKKDSTVAYLISRCLHNWSDQHSRIILRSLIPGLRKGSRLLIWDSVLEDRPVRKFSERLNLQQDFIMATISNGKDRTAKEFQQLLTSSDERFRIENIRKPEGSKLSMIEVMWEG